MERQRMQAFAGQAGVAVMLADFLAGLLLVMGLLQWLALGVAGVDLFAQWFGAGPWAARMLYCAVAVAAWYAIWTVASYARR